MTGAAAGERDRRSYVAVAEVRRRQARAGMSDRGLTLHEGGGPDAGTGQTEADARLLGEYNLNNG